MRYTVEIQFEGRAGLEVDAPDAEAAKTQALETWGKNDIYDFGTPEIVECYDAIRIETTV